MAIDFSERSARDTALRWTRDQLAQVLSVTEALGEPLLAVQICQALDVTHALLARPDPRP